MPSIPGAARLDAGSGASDRTHVGSNAASRRESTGAYRRSEYPPHFLVRTVTTAGMIRFQGRLVHPAIPLVDQLIGLAETDDDIRAIYFDAVLIGTMDERDRNRARVTPQECYPCCRTLFLPIYPAVHHDQTSVGRNQWM